MEYHPRMIGDEQKVRFALEQKGSRTLYVVGLNPSTASDKEADPTMRKVMGFAEKNGFDGFVMLNLYPLRSTYPTDLPKEPDEELINKNLTTIAEYLAAEDSPSVLLCYGNNVGGKKYLLQSAERIIELCRRSHAQLLCIGKTVYGHPVHPSRIGYRLFEQF